MELVIKNMSFSKKEKWIVRIFALAIFTLCSFTLANINVYRPLHIRIISSLIDSFILNVLLFTCAVRIPKGSFRYLLIPGVILSGLSGVFLIIPYGWPMIALSVSFYLWFVHKLILQKNSK